MAEWRVEKQGLSPDLIWEDDGDRQWQIAYVYVEGVADEIVAAHNSHQAAPDAVRPAAIEIVGLRKVLTMLADRFDLPSLTFEETWGKSWHDADDDEMARQIRAALAADAAGRAGGGKDESMDPFSTVIGFVVGLVIGLMATLIHGGQPTEEMVATIQPRRSGRVSKKDLACRDCGTQMVERYPGSVGARRHVICKVCDYFDSYLDHDRVLEERARVAAQAIRRSHPEA